MNLNPCLFFTKRTNDPVLRVDLKNNDCNKLTCGKSVYNLGTGTGTSVLELVRAFEAATGVPVPYEVTARRPGDLAECYADVSKAKQELGWTAKRDITAMCRDAWRFEEQHQHT